MVVRYYNNSYYVVDKANAYATPFGQYSTRITANCYQNPLNLKEFMWKNTGKPGYGGSCESARAQYLKLNGFDKPELESKYKNFQDKGSPGVVGSGTVVRPGEDTRPTNPIDKKAGGDCNNHSGKNAVSGCCNCDSVFAVGCHIEKWGCEAQNGLWNGIKNGGLIVPLVAVGMLFLIFTMRWFR